MSSDDFNPSLLKSKNRIKQLLKQLYASFGAIVC